MWSVSYKFLPRFLHSFVVQHTGLRGSINPLLEEADIDKDGRISLSEFRRLLRTASMSSRGVPSPSANRAAQKMPFQWGTLWVVIIMRVSRECCFFSIGRLLSFSICLYSTGLSGIVVVVRACRGHGFDMSCSLSPLALATWRGLVYVTVNVVLVLLKIL